MNLWSILDWFAGNGRYMDLYHCMGNDRLWIAITVLLDFSVAAGYGLIALHWWKNQKLLPPTPARRALGNMRNIFLFCGICGYLFIPIKMYWPAWRLYDLFMVVLVYFTWKYAWGAKDLKVVYNELGRTQTLADDLQKSREDARRKSLFLNAISHDLRTPLNGLMLQANLVEMGAGTNDHAAVEAAVMQIKSGARAVGDLLDTLLEYSRLEASSTKVNLSRFSLVDLVNEVVSSLEAAVMGSPVRLAANVPANLLIYSDRSKVYRILLNLLNNAVKFTPSGSVKVEVQSSQQGVEIHVIDTGIGISKHDQERLFEEFFQVNNHERDRSKGFGLGLAIARQLARQLGGDISVQSSLGRGSRFTLVLPRALVGEQQLLEQNPRAESVVPALSR